MSSGLFGSSWWFKFSGFEKRPVNFRKKICPILNSIIRHTVSWRQVSCTIKTTANVELPCHHDLRVFQGSSRMINKRVIPYKVSFVDFFCLEIVIILHGKIPLRMEVFQYFIPNIITTNHWVWVWATHLDVRTSTNHPKIWAAAQQLLVFDVRASGVNLKNVQRPKRI